MSLSIYLSVSVCLSLTPSYFLTLLSHALSLSLSLSVSPSHPFSLSLRFSLSPFSLTLRLSLSPFLSVCHRLSLSSFLLPLPTAHPAIQPTFESHRCPVDNKDRGITSRAEENVSSDTRLLSPFKNHHVPIHSLIYTNTSLHSRTLYIRNPNAKLL